MNKTCCACGEEKSLTEFHRDKSKKDGYKSRCKECHKVWYQPYDAEIDRKKKLKSTYGITPEDYNNMFKEQKGCCAICGVHQSERKKRLAVDHCHKTGKIRGLLCSNCNTGIGNLRDSIELLEQAIKYLRRYN